MTQQEIDQIADGKFIIDCPRMVLRQNKEQSPRVYEGAGSIMMTDGQLWGKMFCNSGDHFWGELLGFGVATGEIIPDSEYFSLHAVDWKNGTWQSNRLRPDTNTGPGGGVVTF